MFEWCVRLTNLDVSGFKTGNVEDMSRMFKGCSALTCLDLSNFKMGNVKYKDDMFADCPKLKKIIWGEDEK